jgi:hypothetical protein
MAAKARSDVIGTDIGCPAKLREAVLVAKNVSDMDIATRNYVKVLAKRLERVCKWGGAYGSIDFSPQVKALIEDHRPVILSAGEMAELDYDRSALRLTVNS